jgi:hypothetical protein
MRIYCSAPYPHGRLPTGGCKQLVKQEGMRCSLHGGKGLNRRRLLAKLELAELRCGNDQVETKQILQEVIHELR